jgi:hypothetical protein
VVVASRGGRLAGCIYSTHADVMRRAYRATHGYVYMVWDGRRWLQQVDGQWVGI